MNTERKPMPGWIRIVAIFLAILFVGELFLFNSAGIKFSSKDYEGTELEEAADYLQDNDPYLNASRLQRMRNVAATLGTPKTYDEYSLFASVAIADQDYTRAAGYLNTCAEMFTGDDKELADIYVKIGCLWALDKQWKAAGDSFSHAISLNSENSKAYLMLCEARLNTQEYERALDALETYGTMESYRPEEFDALIQLQVNLGRFEDALSSCDQALEAPDTDKPTFLNYKAQTAYLMGNFAEAKRLAQESLDAGGGKTQGLSLISLCCSQEGDYSGAFLAASKILEEENAAPSDFEQAVQYAYLVSDYPSIEEFSSTALEKFGDTPETVVFRKWLGIAQVEKDDYTQALKNLTEYFQKEGKDAISPELYYLRGLCALANEDYALAEKDFSSGMKSDELKDECLYNRGLCRMKLEKTELAAQDFQEIIDRNADNEILKMTCELLEIDEETLQIARNEGIASKQSTEAGKNEAS